MTGVVHALAPRLTRAIVVRQVDKDRWRVEGCENQAGRWRFTWVLMPAAAEARARRYAARLARHTGLPVGERPLGGRISLVAGVLGASARRVA